MLFLIAGLLCSAMVSIVLKASSRWEYDRYFMLAINYMACLIPFIISRIGQPSPAINKDFGLCIIFAAINDFLYLAGMVMNQVNVRRNGAILQSTFSRLGVMVPTCLSIVFFGERPSAKEVIGIIMVLVAFCIMNIPQEKTETSKEHQKPVFTLLILGLLFNGIVDSFLKVFEEFGSQSLNDWFMGFTFIFASLICFTIAIAKKGRIGKKEIVVGLSLGIPNYLSSLFLLKSLSDVSAYIAYPTYSVGAILVVIAASTFIFCERITKWCMISIALIIPAILLLNL